MIIEAAPTPIFLQFFAAGIGCRKNTPSSEIIALIDTTLAEAGLSPDRLGLIATLDGKLNEPGIVAAAIHFDVPLRGFDRKTMSGHDLPTPSATVFLAIGIAGVAEAAAMALGPLVLPKRKFSGATCALSRMQSMVSPSIPMVETAPLLSMIC